MFFFGSQKERSPEIIGARNDVRTFCGHLRCAISPGVVGGGLIFAWTCVRIVQICNGWPRCVPPAVCKGDYVHLTRLLLFSGQAGCATQKLATSGGSLGVSLDASRLSKRQTLLGTLATPENAATWLPPIFLGILRPRPHNSGDTTGPPFSWIVGGKGFLQCPQKLSGIVPFGFWNFTKSFLEKYQNAFFGRRGATFAKHLRSFRFRNFTKSVLENYQKRPGAVPKHTVFIERIPIVSAAHVNQNHYMLIVPLSQVLWGVDLPAPDALREGDRSVALEFHEQWYEDAANFETGAAKESKQANTRVLRYRAKACKWLPGLGRMLTAATGCCLSRFWLPKIPADGPHARE